MVYKYLPAFFIAILSGMLFLSTATMTYTAPERKPILTYEEVFKELMWCESRNNIKAINYDDGKIGEHSRGPYQFKEETFNHFGKRYGLPHDDIWSVKQQEDIAKEMLKEGRWEHWYICLNKIYESST